MTYYDALKAGWPSLKAGTTEAKLAHVNALRVATTPQKALLEPSRILNAITFADIAALSNLQVAQLTMLLSGNLVDASAGTTIRVGIQALFAGKVQTLANLGALVSPFDNPTIPWWQSVGMTGPVGAADLVAAGNLT